MIDSAVIKNFQSHKHTEVDFTDGVNVIIGPSDAGKSSIFRAINWVLSNRPLGEAFRSEWGGETSVTLHTDDNMEIRRIRSDKKNLYIVNGTELKAFGSEPPEEVFNALQIDACNIQSQMDPPFLLAKSPGETAQMLNRAASIDDIDRVTASLRKSYLQLDRTIQSNKEGLKEQKEELSHYDYIDEAEQKIVEVEKEERSIEETQQRKKKIGQCSDRIKDITIALDKTNHIPTALDAIHSLEDLNEKYIKLYNKYIRVVNIQDEVKHLRNILKSSKNVDDNLNLIAKAEQTLKQFQNQQRQYDGLVKVLGRTTELIQNIENVNEELQSREKEYKELSPDICPLCGHVINK